MTTLPRLLRLPLIVAAMWLAVAPSFAEEFRQGVDYDLVEPAQNTSADGTIEIVEIFWYGCPHCFDFEPFIDAWLEEKPDDVAFVRMPAVFRQSWAVHARAFYAADAMGVLDKVHSELFRAIHVDRRELFDQESIAAFVAGQGVSKAEFNSAYESFSVEGKSRKAAQMSRAYGITGVPAVIVNGKYRSSGRMAGSYERLLKVVDFLVAKEREGLQAGS